MSEGRPPIASVEAVREELRRLGYLETGLDRFVLAGAGGPSPLRASLAVAARVGVAGGLLLGGVLAAAAASLDRRLLSDPADLAVLTVYLVVALGMVTAAAALAGGLVAGWIGRRLGRRPGPHLSRNAGLAVGLSGLAYLALWWRSHASGAPLLVQAAALVVGLGLAIVLGRFGSLAAVAVLSAGGAMDRLPQASLTRRHLLPLLALGTLLLGGGFAAASWLAGGPGPEAPDFAVVPTHLRVRVLGIDGLEQRMVDQLVARGEMPRLERLLGAGARAALRAEPERVPAIVWTTIATGRGPEAHGIQSTGTRRLAGMKTPVPLDSEESRFGSAVGAAADLLRITRTQPPTSVLRSVKAFWNVASEKGLRVGVVNWWATWPADAVNGYVVTDRAYFKLEKGGRLDREVFPPETFERLRPLSPGGDDRARRLDRFAIAAARALRGAAPPDLEAVYLPGLDIVSMQRLGEAEAADVAGLDARLEAVREHYRFVDTLVGEAAEDLGPRDVLVLVGDPGRLARESPAPRGVLLIVGGPAAPGDLGEVSQRDIAPTVLHLVGLPVSRELDGRVLEAALAPSFRGAHPPRMVASYGRRPALRPAESAFDRDMLEELRSLGYIQ
jgi:hypothetical protein